MAAAEGRSMDSPELLPSAVQLAPVRLEGPETISFLPIRYQIAQKLHACTEDAGDPPNQRVRDLHDFILIEELAVRPDDYQAVREACLEVFEGRDRHV
jgi:Fe-S-cluster formation regulator IscX/YfhJ